MNATLRLLMNLILMRAGFPPVIIRRADRWASWWSFGQVWCDRSSSCGRWSRWSKWWSKALIKCNRSFSQGGLLQTSPNCQWGRREAFHKVIFVWTSLWVMWVFIELCVQVYSIVHRENPGSLPVGQPGVHDGGGGGWVHQPSTQPCGGFNGGGWHGCEEVTSI